MQSALYMFINTGIARSDGLDIKRRRYPCPASPGDPRSRDAIMTMQVARSCFLERPPLTIISDCSFVLSRGQSI